MLCEAVLVRTDCENSCKEPSPHSCGPMSFFAEVYPDPSSEAGSWRVQQNFDDNVRASSDTRLDGEPPQSLMIQIFDVEPLSIKIGVAGMFQAFVAEMHRVAQENTRIYEDVKKRTHTDGECDCSDA